MAPDADHCRATHRLVPTSVVAASLQSRHPALTWGRMKATTTRGEVAEGLSRRFPSRVARRPARRGVLAPLAGLVGLVMAVLWAVFVAASPADAGELPSPSVPTEVRGTLPSVPHLPAAGASSGQVPPLRGSALPPVPQPAPVPTIPPPVPAPMPAPGLTPSLTLPTGEAAALFRRAATDSLTSPIRESDVGTNAALPLEGGVATKEASPTPASSIDVPQVMGTANAETGLIPTPPERAPIRSNRCGASWGGAADAGCTDGLSPGPAKPAPVIPLAPLFFLAMPPPVAPTVTVLARHYSSAPAAVSLLLTIPDARLRAGQVMFASATLDLYQAPPRGPPRAVDLSEIGGRP